MPVTPPFNPPGIVPNYWSFTTLWFNRSQAFPDNPEFWNVFPNHLRVYDINADGHLDVLIVYSFIPAEERPGIPIRVLLGDGEGNLTDGTAALFPNGAPVGDAAGSSVVADFNGDGVDDIFIGVSWETVNPIERHSLLLLSDGNGGVIDASDSLPQDLQYTHWTSGADIDGDGDVDLYVCNLGTGDPTDPNGASSYFLINDGGGNFTRSDSRLPATIEDGTRSYTSSLLFDADNDGDSDLVLGTWPQWYVNGWEPAPSLVLFNDGSGNFVETEDSVLPAPLFAIDRATILDMDAVDLNGDGYADLLLLNENPFQHFAIQLLINNGDGTFRDETAARLPDTQGFQNHRFMHFADLNADGVTDLILETGDTRRFFLNDGTGHFVALPGDFLFTNGGYYAFVPGDFNEDGRTDFLVRTIVNSWDDPNNVTEFDWIALWTQPAGTVLAGDGAANAILGDAQAETLSGLGGNDVIFGGAGADSINGGSGADTVVGGAGDDSFVGTAAELSGDTIRDFGIGDRIVISDASLAAFAYSISGSTLTYSGGSLTLGAGIAGRIVVSAAPGGGVQLTHVPPPRATLTLTASGQDFTIGGDVLVYGTTAPGEVIELLHGDVRLDASFNIGGDTVVLPGNASSYTAVLAGSFVTIDGGGLTVAIPVGIAGLNVQFADSTRVLRFDTGAGQVMLGAQAVTSVEAPVAAIGAPLSDPAETGPSSLGRLVLAEAGQDIDIGGNVSIFGSTAPGEVITILEGTVVLDASFNAGGDTVVLPGNAGSYTATLAGSFVTIAGGGISVAIPVGIAGLTVDFADADRVLRFDTSAGQVMLGSQAITSGGGPVAGARLASGDDAFAKDALADGWAHELRLEVMDGFVLG